MHKNTPFPSTKKNKNFLRKGYNLSPDTSTLGKGTPSLDSTPSRSWPLGGSPLFKMRCAYEQTDDRRNDAGELMMSETAWS